MSTAETGQPALVNPPELAPPSGFSHAVVVPATGRYVYLAGQTGMDARGRIVPGDIVDQFEQALANLLTALRAAGGEPQHLVRVTVYLTDVPDYQTRSRDIGQVWQRLVGRYYPAMTGVGVARLWDLEAMIELEGTAVIP